MKSAPRFSIYEGDLAADAFGQSQSRTSGPDFVRLRCSHIDLPLRIAGWHIPTPSAFHRAIIRMTVAETMLAMFTVFNSLRFLAYLPQIAKAARDQSGAEAISFGT